VSTKDDADDWQDLRRQALDEAQEISDSIEQIAARRDLELSEKARGLKNLIETER